MKYVVIGAGPAGVVGAETLRARDPAGEVVLIHGEKEPIYSRMALPYFLSNDIKESGTHLRSDPNHFERLNIQTVSGPAVSLDTAKRTVSLSGGGTVSYDRLLLASGARPLNPPIQGIDQEGVYHCWTLQDSRNIVRMAKPGSKVVLIGAGFIGCIILGPLLKRKIDLTVVEVLDRMLARQMDETGGRLLKTWCENRGVKIHTSAKVTAVEPDSKGPARFRLKREKGDPIPADCVVVAAGIKPITDYLEKTGIKIQNGVVVDEYLETSIPGIYAAGDVCEGFDWSTGSRTVLAIQPVAAETGRVAAMNMTGMKTPYPGGLSMNVVDVGGLICTSYGQWMGVPSGDESRLLDEKEFRYLRLQFKDDLLVGALSIGLTNHVGILRGLIQSKIKLGEWKPRLKEDPTRIMEAYLAATQLSAETV
jgi:NAD(P)H-nitrite reductase large subunit